MTDPNSHQHHGHETDTPAHGEHHHGSVSAHASADAHGTREGQHTGHQGHAMDHGQHSGHTGLDEHGGHDEHAQHGGHGDHSGHGGHGDHVGQFRRLFWINLVIAIPAVALSPMFAMLLGYEVPGWAGWVAAALGTVMYVWGGRPFLTGAVSELKSRKPGMMLLIALAITVAFFASWAATLGLVHHELEFWWELALLIVIMLLGHWIEMRSLAQTTSALDSLAALLPDEAERVEGENVVKVAPADLDVGDVVIVRPGGGAYGVEVLLPVLTAASWALAVVATRKMAGADRPATTLFWSAAVGFAVLSALLPFDFVAPSAGQIGLGLRDRGLALLAGDLHRRREVVHRVEVDVVQRRHLGLDVARHGQVDHEDRAVAALFQRAFDGAQADDGQGAGGAADDGVEFVQALGQVGQQHAAHGRGERGQARADVEAHPQDPLGVHAGDVHQVRPVEHARGAGLVQALRGLGEDRPEDLGDGPAGPVAVAELQHARGQREPPPVLHGVALIVHTHRHRGLLAGVADRLDLLDLVGPGQQVLAAFKQLAAEIGPQAVSHDRLAAVVGHPGELPDLRGGEELRLVDEDAAHVASGALEGALAVLGHEREHVVVADVARVGTRVHGDAVRAELLRGGGEGAGPVHGAQRAQAVQVPGGGIDGHGVTVPWDP